MMRGKKCGGIRAESSQLVSLCPMRGGLCRYKNAGDQPGVREVGQVPAISPATWDWSSEISTGAGYKTLQSRLQEVKRGNRMRCKDKKAKDERDAQTGVLTGDSGKEGTHSLWDGR